MIIRKGDEQAELGLAQAAKEQKAMKPSDADKAFTGRDNKTTGYLSNLMVTGGKHTGGIPTASSTDYSASSRAGEKVREKVQRPVSGTSVAIRAAKMDLPSVKKQGNKSAAFGEMGSGRIKGGIVQPSKSAAPKKKAATAKDVRSALGAGKIEIEEASDLNKKGLSSPIKKKKK